MTNEDRQALVTLCLMAAFADGTKNEAERAQLERIAADRSGPGFDLGSALQDALMSRVTAGEVAARISSVETRREAYEMAVCVCQADDVLNDSERAFLAELRQSLGLPDEAAAVIEQEAQRVARPPVVQAEGLAASVPSSTTVPSPGGLGDAGFDAELDRSILNHALLAGGLELLPNSLATMAIIPLQIKLVYGVGKRYGYELDRGHIKDFLATAGVGLSAQVAEGFASKLLTGLVGKAMGRLGQAAAGQVTSSAFSFATTYALGQAARQYYAGGRRLGAVELKSLFNKLLGEGRALQEQYLPQIREQASRIRVNELLPMLTAQR